jgi:alpha-galactosidase
MKKVNVIFLLVVQMVASNICPAQNKGGILLLQSRFITGNEEVYNLTSYDDTHWEQQKLGDVWQSQGHDGYHGYAWYRIHVILPSSLKKTAFWKDSLRIFLAHVNDVDETFLNGIRIGHIGSFPSEPGGYVSKWPAIREYHVALSSTVINWDEDNVIAIKVFDGGGSGGIFMGQPYVDVLEKINGLKLQINNHKIIYNAGLATAVIEVFNTYNTSIKGVLTYNIKNNENNLIIQAKQLPFELRPFQKKTFSLVMPDQQGIAIQAAFTESSSKLADSLTRTLPYILTPSAGNKPSVNGTTVMGLQPGHPFIYTITATGKKTLIYAVKNLPEGLQLNTATGVISGTIKKEGDYNMQVIVKNNIGAAQKNVTIKVGKQLALTPPMGWNSWNCWGTSVSAEKVATSAAALINTGLINHGWNYINIDDGWEAKQRAADGNIQTNEKFTSMKKLGDYLHSKGLRFGIYSSPGTHTCGGFIGSYEHELLDAVTYSGWGVDYLKYDLCSYLDSMKNKVSLADHQLPYKVMRDALKAQNRDIVYSLCQYGIKDVWKWGAGVNGNLWRTTEDIEDTWASMLNIGFKQDTLYKYAKPGNWNDPDMLTVGMVGWGENLHPSRLTVDEQYTQMSLWSMLSAPLLIGCDITNMDKFTLNLLTNDEVIAVDQDALGRQARKITDKDSIQVWIKEMAGGDKVAAIFNMSANYKNYTLPLEILNLKSRYKIRDIWRQKDLRVHQNSISKIIPSHGVYLIRLTVVVK